MVFQPGKSGNPSGRPKKDVRLTELCREFTEEAIKTLASVMLNIEAPPADRIKAANSLLDRGYGKPHQSIDASVSGNVTNGGFTLIISERELPKAIDGQPARQLPSK